MSSFYELIHEKDKAHGGGVYSVHFEELRILFFIDFVESRQQIFAISFRRSYVQDLECGGEKMRNVVLF